MKEKLSKFSAKWKMLSRSQKFSLLGVMTPLLILPLTLYLVANSTNIVSDASNKRVPISAPEVNSVPVILTEELPLGSVGRNYRERIDGYDLDLTDKLDFNFSGLPEGLSVRDCRQTVRSGVADVKGGKVLYITCDIRGVVNTSGDYEITAALTDLSGAQVEKVFNLQVE